MPKFFNTDLADLAQQLTRSPRRLRVEQIRGVERLLGLIDPDKAYPFDFVCYHITKYRKRGAPDTGSAIPGKALINDLVSLAELISRKANLRLDEIDEACHTQHAVAERLGVSTKTIRRWRDRGLMGVRLVFEDGVNRLAFLERTIDRFTRQHAALVEKGASFTQLTTEERETIVRRARELLEKKPLKLHATACLIAEETGRAVETVRYTLRRYDEAHRDTALFRGRNDNELTDRQQAMWRCHENGESTGEIAAAFDCPPDEVLETLRLVELTRWRKMSWDHIHDELFDAPDADRLILEAPEPPASDAPSVRPPRDVPAYLRSLYATPLLTAEQERDLFRRYNYLKFKVSKALKRIQPESVDADAFEALRQRVEKTETIKQRIIRANLRLVVSIAKKHIGFAPDFFEIVSDGNMSLMRAVEKFDYTRGTKFSTYATWAIVKNYARSIPEQRYRRGRYVTGQDELLEAAPDQSAVAASESDRRRIRELIADGLKELTEREREVLSGHFGLGHQGDGLTLEQLGQRFGVTKERVRQIERRALQRLREVLSPTLADALTD